MKLMFASDIHGLLSDVPLDKVAEFEKLYMEILRAKHQKDVLDVLKSGVINDTVTAILEEEAKQITSKYRV